MNQKKAPVGPLDVTQWLADVKAGKKAPRTVSVPVFLNPELAQQYDGLVDKFNALVEADNAVAESSLTDDVPDNTEELDRIQAQMDALLVEAEQSRVPFVFRSYQDGDQTAILAKMGELGLKPTDIEGLAVVGIAQFCVSIGGEPVTLDVDTVKAMIPHIGYAQYSALTEAYQAHVYGAPTGPKLRRPLRSRGTATL